MRRRAWMLGLLCSILAGCGGANPVSFAEKNKPLAQSMQSAVRAKKMEDIERITKLAKERAEKDDMTSLELGVLQQCEDYAKNDEWDRADKLITDSIRMH